MKARPILFSAPMVRALLAGTKSQTRRLVKPQPFPNGFISTNGELLTINDHLPPNAMLLRVGKGINCYATSNYEGWESACPYGFVGDLLWVRETWTQHTGSMGESLDTYYAADDADIRLGPWRPSIHMPRSASRLTLRITDVRAQRLQEISEEDATAEGATPTWNDGRPIQHDGSGAVCRERFSELWQSINGPGSWDANPWVWCVSFITIKHNIDAVLAKEPSNG